MTANIKFDPIAEARRQWVSRWGEEPGAPLASVTSIMRVQQILTARLNALLKPFGLSFSRYEALMLLYLSRRGALPLSKIGERLQVHPTSVTSLMDGLENSGLVRRDPHESDRRTTLASITPKGRKVALECTSVMNAARFGMDPLDEGSLETISSLLNQIRASAGDVVEA